MAQERNCSPMPSHPCKLPREGTFQEHPLPRVLLAAAHERATGTLEISRERLSKRITLDAGVPVFVESNLARESLGAQLVSAERISAEDQERVSAYVKDRGAREGAALLALKLIEPKELFVALRDQVRRRIVDAFSWPDGRFRFEAADAGRDEAQAFRVDPIVIVQQGLATHWSVERLLADLEARLSQHAVPSETFEALSARLEAPADGGGLLADLDPMRTFGEAVYRSPSPDRLACAWLLAESGALAFQDGPPADPAAGEPGEAADAAEGEDTEPTLEFLFEDAPDDDATSDTAGSHGPGGADAALSPEAEQLRKEILEKHERIDELSHYELLGVPSDAGDGPIKKAYFQLAKRAHPDALARVGLASLHREANELFARIAQAYQTLSDKGRRKEYDAKQAGDAGGTPSSDANRLAQAETLFRKAEIMIKIGNFGGALDFLKPCVELWPDEPDYQGALGWALYKNRPADRDGAREHLELAQAAKPNDPLLCFRLGMVLRKLGEAERAQELLDRAKSLEKKG